MISAGKPKKQRELLMCRASPPQEAQTAICAVFHFTLQGISILEVLYLTCDYHRT